MTPYFSLILPCYNVASYVERCVRSILEQNDTDYEIILVDDGSTDETPAICDLLAGEHPCIRVIHKANGGLASARNAGLDAARGLYIWFIDSDDWIEPDALTTLFQACADTKPDMVKFSHYRVAAEKQIVPGLVSPGMYEGDVQLDVLRRQAFCAAGKYVLSAWSHIYRREFLQVYGLSFVSERLICSEDYLFNLEALLHAEGIVVVDTPLYCYELRQGSLTQTYKPDIAVRYTELYRRLQDAYREHGAYERYGALIDRFYVWHLVIGTCFQHEYRIHHARHTLAQARKNVRDMLRNPAVSHAANCSDRGGLSWQKRLQLLAVQLRLEPLFYWLCVTKPRKIADHNKKE